MKLTSVASKNIEAYKQGKRLIVNKGATRSSKTYSILQLLVIIAEFSSSPKIISIVSESMPHLKRGCIRDFQKILMDEGIWNENNWNKTDKIYKINKSSIEFFSVDNPGKVHGPARNVLYVNECINIEYEVYKQLATRTTETIFLDYNPCFEFWVDELILPRPESCLVHSTYKDNEFLSEHQVREIEVEKENNPEWFKVYGLGETGQREGVIIQNWDIVESMPSIYKKRWIGIDFGYTNDPTPIIDIRLADGGLWINELLYSTGYDNPMIAQHLSDMNVPLLTPIIADSAEPKSIAEIAAFGWNIEPAQKGKDSILSGISILNRYKKHITQNSLNTIKEYRNYRWKSDEFGKPTNIPIDRYNHSIDAQRYVCLNQLATVQLEFDAIKKEDW